MWALWRVRGAGQDGGRAGKLWFSVNEKTLPTFSLKSVTITCFLLPFLFLPSFFLFPFSLFLPTHLSSPPSLSLLPSSLPPSLLSSPFLPYLFSENLLTSLFQGVPSTFCISLPRSTGGHFDIKFFKCTESRIQKQPEFTI